LLAGDSVQSLYLQRGKIRWWLPIGVAAFGFFALTSLWAAQYLFGSEPLALDTVAPVIPWVLIFVLTNGFAEEMLFRGLLLPRFKPLVGTTPAILVVTTVFALWHLGANYAGDLPTFLVVVSVLGLLWGILTVKTDSLWGAALFHAGTDIPVALAILAAL
jgi:membrane protease YdiL (CAAX protease family)